MSGSGDEAAKTSSAAKGKAAASKAPAAKAKGKAKAKAKSASKKEITTVMKSTMKKESAKKESAMKKESVPSSRKGSKSMDVDETAATVEETAGEGEDGPVKVEADVADVVETSTSSKKNSSMKKQPAPKKAAAKAKATAKAAPKAAAVRKTRSGSKSESKSSSNSSGDVEMKDVEKAASKETTPVKKDDKKEPKKEPKTEPKKEESPEEEIQPLFDIAIDEPIYLEKIPKNPVELLKILKQGKPVRIVPSKSKQVEKENEKTVELLNDLLAVTGGDTAASEHSENNHSLDPDGNPVYIPPKNGDKPLITPKWIPVVGQPGSFQTPGRDHFAHHELDPNWRFNRTTPYMSKYEKTRVLAQRVLQITMGAPVLIDLKKHGMSFSGHGCAETPNVDAEKVAEIELKEGVLPLIVRRKMADGTFEDWRCGDLMDPDF